MNERRKRALSAKHLPDYREVRINNKSEKRMKKVIFMTRKIERRFSFIRDKKNRNDYAMLNTGISTNTMADEVLLAEKIRCMGDIPYDFDVDE